MGILHWFEGEQDHDAWIKAWKSIRNPRPHDHPDYLKMMCKEGEVPIAVFYESSKGGCVFYAFTWRPLFFPLTEGEADAELDGDIVSPYGYGGPIYDGPYKELEAISLEFEEKFRERLREQSCIAEFVREDIFRERLALRQQGELSFQSKNVVVHLDMEPAERWMAYKQKVRKNVKRAHQEGLSIEFDIKGERLNDFISVYSETMNRKGASESFLIPREDFLRLINTLGSDGGIAFVHVLDGVQVVSSELLLRSNDTLYSFLGGTKTSAFQKRPNDLLKHAVIDWGRKEGYQFYVLGGGFKQEDGIFRYKLSFEPNGVLPFFVRRVIHHPLRYKKALDSRRAYEKEHGNMNWEPDPNFFPAYRG